MPKFDGYDNLCYKDGRQWVSSDWEECGFIPTDVITMTNLIEHSYKS